ncbi:hypothetical protein KP77_04720 [Jeotgalibacillus alimentarius]|uniref:Uncharacterized protein n=1 Tax=Jeotgalibacillus alimentarius TaxID=135826 RepID=A0A0C2WAB0_9BACL|nr:hypothetical protein [Jeotgalibacillus alimentarius]KIL53496.1 hypothetical protein KP77_04720 [Jeotgalibacillus alimentarius]
MVKLSKFKINFDIHQETPYFQVPKDQRIRFGMEDLSVSKIKNVIESVFQTGDTINLIFVSAYIVNHKRYSSNSKIGKYIHIQNWREVIVTNPSLRDSTIYTTISHLDLYDIVKYCISIFRGQKQAYISFYNHDFLLYVNNDVIDIISHDIKKIEELKKQYTGVFNTFYE